MLFRRPFPGRSRHSLALALSLLLAAPLAQAAGSFSGLYVLGDSLSDTGNAALAVGRDSNQVILGDLYVPQKPYASGTLSNGPVWASYFSKSLGLGDSLPSIGGGTNYAFGGARTSGGSAPSLTAQAGLLLAAAGGKPLPSDALYVVAGGGNTARDALADILSGANVEATLLAATNTYVSDVGAIVDNLQAAGARHIVVWNVPNLGLTPAAIASGPLAQFGATFLAQQMNLALDTRLATETGVLTFDVYGLLTGLVAEAQQSPATASFTNVTRACGSPLSGCSAATALFWDGIHPTTRGHELIASGMAATVAAIPEPGTYALMLGGLALLGLAIHRQRRSM